jgi:signal transduction histidine kinase/HPt (histidine-containing phosphotransfer) domain-containing protein
MAVDNSAPGDQAEAVFAGRIDVLYTLGRHYLSLPFAALCVPASFIAHHPPGILPLVPLLLLIVAAVAAEQLTTAYRERAAGSDPHYWARRYTVASSIAGAAWGVGALFWFVPDSFPAQAYLALAFLGMTATEFIARSAHRPAYAAHCCLSLLPLIGLLLWQGGLYAIMTALLIGFFGAVLISYCNGMARLLDESVTLRNENSGLVTSLRRETREAIAARDEAQASAHAKTSFIANISHELRTPLNALLGMAQLLERAELPRQQADHVKVMLDAGRGLQTLIDDVLALTRDEFAPMEDGECDPVQAARAVTRLLQPRAWEKRLRLTLSAAPDLPRVAADPRKVRQALLKLADNAVKFTERGLVDIRLDAVTGKDGHAAVRFTVSDTGTGVTPDAAKALFSPFTPGDSSYARREQGAGLGLAVAKRIVEQAQGEIGFEDLGGEGSQFFLTLPVSGSMAGAADAGSAGENQQGPPSGLSLLVCVGAPGANAVIARLLEPFGNKLAIAENLADAIERGARQNFDAIIVGAGDADMLAAVPGVHAPLVAVLMRGDRAPAATDTVLRWPLEADPFYRALDAVCVKPERDGDDAAALSPAIDAAAIAAVEQSVGGTRALIEILQCYIVTAEDLMTGLSTACQDDKWDEAARLAQDIVGAAGGLGLAAMTTAARRFAKSAREGEDRHGLRNAAQGLWTEHLRARRALRHLYPDLAA